MTTQKDQSTFVCGNENCPCHQPKEVELEDGSYLVEESEWEEEFDEIMSHLNWGSCICCGRYRNDLKPKIRTLLDKVREEAHDTESGYCCACEYDIAVMNEKIAEAREEVLAEVEKKLKHIAMIDNGNSPKYFVKDVLEVLDELNRT